MLTRARLSSPSSVSVSCSLFHCFISITATQRKTCRRKYFIFEQPLQIQIISVNNNQPQSSPNNNGCEIDTDAGTSQRGVFAIPSPKKPVWMTNCGSYSDGRVPFYLSAFTFHRSHMEVCFHIVHINFEERRRRSDVNAAERRRLKC